eukprot:1600456-Prymnesium_polylepis.1
MRNCEIFEPSAKDTRPARRAIARRALAQYSGDRTCVPPMSLLDFTTVFWELVVVERRQALALHALAAIVAQHFPELCLVFL